MACLFELRWPWAASVPDRHIISTYRSGTPIHGYTSIKSDDGSVISTDQTMFIVNPLGYDDLAPHSIIEDIIEHQAHVGLGRVRFKPTGDITTNWTRSTGTGTWFGHVDEGTAQKQPTSGYIYTTGKNIVQRFSYYNQSPANLSRAIELTIRMWCSLQESGTAEGLGITAFLYGTSGQIGTWAKTAVVKHDGTNRYIELKWQNLDISKAELDTLEVELISRRYLDNTPNTNMRVYAIDVDAVYETTDIDLVDSASFTALDAYYIAARSWYLRGDFFNTSFADAIMEILNHAPYMYLAIANDATLRCLNIPTNLQATTPDHDFIYGDEVSGYGALVERLKWRERLATSTILNYGVQNGNQASPGSADATNNTGFSKMEYEGEPYLDVPEKNPTQRSRVWFNDSTIAELALSEEEVVFKEAIDSVIIETNWCALLLLEGDSIMGVTIPEENMDRVRYLVADVELNLDDLSAVITGLAISA